MEIYFYYTKAAQKTYFITTGKVLANQDRVEYEPLTLTATQRELVYGHNCILPLENEFNYPCTLDDILAHLEIVQSKKIEQRDREIAEALTVIENLEQQEPEKIADIFLAQKVYTTKYFENRSYHQAKGILLQHIDLPNLGENIKKRLSSLNQKDKAASLAFDRKIKDREQQQIEEEKQLQQKKQLEKEQEQANRRDWIERYGDERLKLSESNGYNCQRLYVVARAKHEFPEFILDFDNVWGYKKRVSPSLPALKKLEEYKASRIVWVTESPDDRWNDIGIEALVIQNFLGEYDLLLPIVEGKPDPVEDTEDQIVD